MTPEYPELVLSTYKKMRDNGELYMILPRETTAALKNACLKVYDSRYNQDDADILSVFFNVDKMKCDFRKVISEVKSDYFKALYNHIRDETDTNERNSDLLAWLINFKPRPSGSYYKNLRENIKLTEKSGEKITEVIIDNTNQNIGQEQLTGNIALENQENLGVKLIECTNELTTEPTSQSTTEIIGKTEDEKESISKPITPPVVIIPIKINDGKIDEDNTKPPVQTNDPIYIPRFSPRYITISCILLLFIGSSSFVAWENSTISVRMPKADEKCMYWNEDHYEPVKCNAQIANATITPLDLKKLQRQRKINLSDTLTSYSLGKVWYKGFVKDHEFFTDSGAYPQDIQRVLKPLTNTILTKYTSNYRYLLTRLVWFICAAFFISICGFAVSKLEKEVKAKDESQQQDPEVVLTLEEEPMVKQTEGSFAT